MLLGRFKVPTALLGNIGEFLDYNQSERLHDEDSSEHEVAAKGSEDSTALAWKVSGQSLGHLEFIGTARIELAWALLQLSLIAWVSAGMAVCKRVYKA